MTDDDLELDPSARELLRNARRALSPKLADEERILALTQRALLSAAAESVPSDLEHTQSNPVTAANAPHATVSAVHAGLSSSLWLSLITAAGIAVVSGSVGYVLGHHAAQRELARKQLAVLPAPPVQAASVRPPQPSASGAERPSRPKPEATSQPLSIVSAPARKATVAPSTPASRVAAPPLAAASAGLGQAPASEPSSELVTPALADEVRALRAIQVALRENRPKQALLLLDELDRNVPDGKLSEERSAAFAMARCAIGLGTRAALLREFSEAHPQSVYLARVQHSCEE